MPSRVFTVGHSNRSVEDLVALLRAHDVRRLADIRRFPRSKRHPWFDGAPLAAALAAAGIEYRHFEPLGGYREARPDSPHTGLADGMLRGYADQMATPGFEAAVASLVAWAGSGEGELAVLCAEADPDHCHRRLLADALVTRGIPVEHVVGPGARRPHRRTEHVLVEDGRLVYASPAPRLPGL